MVSQEFNVEDEVAKVTGGGRGIGRAITLTLAKAGADITLIACTREQVEQTAIEVRQLGRKALLFMHGCNQQRLGKRGS